MAASQWYIYNDYLFNSGKGLLDLATANLKVALVASTSNAINQALAGAEYSAITNELSTANGYTAGGVAVTPSWTGGGASATSTLAANTAAWIASGAGITARAAVIYDSTSGYLIAYCLLDSTPADVTVAAGSALAINVGTVFVESRT